MAGLAVVRQQVHVASCWLWEPNHGSRRASMDPQTQFCPNPDCPARGQPGQGNIRVHSHTERRYRCTICGRTFAATTGTPFFRLKHAPDLVTLVLTWLCYGCPLQAIVAAFGLDERTVAAWQARAGDHCQRVHEHLVEQGQVDLGHVQADELWVKLVGRKVWLAMAMAVPSRLWLGGVISLFFFRIRRPPRSTRFPYTTLW